MCKRNVVLKVGPILAVLAAVTPLLRAQSPQLPPGAIEPKVTTACTECHDSRIILQQRLSVTAWGKEVDKMIKWGAVVEAADRQAFIQYLSANFPPDKPADAVPRASAAKRH
ncbi:MAG TPA: hypothetical protein VEK33_00940 [Terriglobales bacterium]|nr:hypothetical protein [Terriglobales bacterium]